MSVQFASSTNVALPGATGAVISFIRDPAKFALAKICQMIQLPTDNPLGYYYKLDSDSPSRLVSEAESDWADGADAPTADANQTRYTTVTFECRRKAYPWRLGDRAVGAAKDLLPLAEIEAKRSAQSAMNVRTNRVVTLLETAANWVGNTDTANNMNGGAGTWDTASADEASPAFLAIKKTITSALTRINLATNGLVMPSDLQLYISPGLAEAMANTGEVHKYLQYGPFSQQILESGNNPNGQWGLPPSIYGLPIVVDQTTRVSTRPAAAGTSGTRATAKSDNSAVIVSRVGGIDGNFGIPSWSTVQIYHVGSLLQVEVFDDRINRRVSGRVTEDFCEVLNYDAGFLVQATL